MVKITTTEQYNEEVYHSLKDDILNADKDPLY